MKKRMLMIASVASMIDQFNMPNIELLLSMGYMVDVACNFKEGNTCSQERVKELRHRLKEMNVRCYQIDFARNIADITKNIKALQQVKTLLSRNHYIFLHCHSPIGGVAGRLEGKKTGTKVIYTAHGFHFFKGAPLKNWLIYYPVERWLSRYTDVLITINHEDYHRAEKFHMKKLFFIPGVGVDINRFSTHRISREDKRKELGLSQDAFVLLSVGELTERKNHTVSIQAFSRLKEQGKIDDAEYIICGNGPLKEELQAQIEQAGLGEHIHLLGYRRDIDEICEITDIFILPSLQEGLPVALMEAMACGLPCIVSYIRGNQDLIHDGGGGFLCNARDINEFAEAIDALFSDKNKCIRMGEENRKQIKKYAVGSVVEDLKEIYDEISKMGSMST